MPTRIKIIEVARRWNTTPYHHQASTRNIGTDCLGLIRGVFRELYGFEPEIVPPYSMSWTVTHETLRDAARRNLTEIDPGRVQAGDVCLFKIKGRAARHAAIITQDDPTMMIHAYSGYSVREEAFERWRKYLVYAFQFPGVE